MITTLAPTSPSSHAPSPDCPQILTLTFRTLPSANSATRVTRTGHVYTRKEIVCAKDDAKEQIAAQVLQAKWRIFADDWYHIDYLFGVSSLLREDADNIEKTTNDCLGRTQERRKKNRRTGLYELITRPGGNAIWDDKRIIVKYIKKTEDVPLDAEGYPITMLVIQKIADPRQPKPKAKKNKKQKKKEETTHDPNRRNDNRGQHDRTSIKYPAH